MSLTSTLLIPFVVITWIIYYTIPKKYQWVTIVVANTVFILTAGGLKSLLSILVTAVTVYFCALRLQTMQAQLAVTVKACASRDDKKAAKAKSGRRQRLLMGSVLVLNFGIWYGFKLWDRFGAAMEAGNSLWMPLAISFYTFIAAGYLIDVYRGKIVPQKNFLRFFAFLTFFPQMTEGPFSRYEDVQEAMFTPHDFSWNRFEEGVFRIMWGYCKKLIVADTLWKSLHIVLNDGFDIYAPSVLAVIFLLPLQQYMDFSGCMDIVLGIAHVMGIDLKENFRQPEFSKSIAEVWRRWHITLCQWFKDYLFYPVATGKTVLKLQKHLKKLAPKAAKFVPPVAAMFVVWTVTGLWHGATTKDLLWGWMNFVILSTSLILEAAYKRFHEVSHIAADSTGWKVFSILRTVFLFGVMETMADVSSASQAIRMYMALLRPAAWRPQPGVDLLPELTAAGAVAIIIFSLMVFWKDWSAERGQEITAMLVKLPTVCKMVLFVALFYCLVMLSSAGGGAGFAYAQF